MFNASGSEPLSRRGTTLRLLSVLAALLLGVAVATSASAIGATPHAGTENVILNGDFSDYTPNSDDSVSSAADWTPVYVSGDPTDCTGNTGWATEATGPDDCNGPYVFVGQADSTAPSCAPLPTSTPFLSEDVPNAGDGGASDAYVQQQVVVPDDATLTFETWGAFEAATGSVSVVSSDGQVTALGSYAVPATQDDAGGCTAAIPLQESYSLASYAGQTVTLRFEGVGAEGQTNGVYVDYDDIALIGTPVTSTPSNTTPTTTTAATLPTTPTTPTTPPTAPTTTTTSGTQQQLASLESQAQSLTAGISALRQDYLAAEDESTGSPDATTSGTGAGFASATTTFSLLADQQSLLEQISSLTAQLLATQSEIKALEGGASANRVAATTSTTLLGTVAQPVAIKLLLPAGSAKPILVLRRLLSAEGTYTSEAKAISTTLTRVRAADAAELWTDARLQWNALIGYDAKAETALRTLDTRYSSLTAVLITALKHGAASGSAVKAALKLLAHPSKALVTDASRLGETSVLRTLTRAAKASKHGSAKATISWLTKGTTAARTLTTKLINELKADVGLDRQLVLLLPA